MNIHLDQFDRDLVSRTRNDRFQVRRHARHVVTSCCVQGEGGGGKQNNCKTLRRTTEAPRCRMDIGP